jgi:hypothetical protein
VRRVTTVIVCVMVGLVAVLVVSELIPARHSNLPPPPTTQPPEPGCDKFARSAFETRIQGLVNVFVDPMSPVAGNCDQEQWTWNTQTVVPMGALAVIEGFRTSLEVGGFTRTATSRTSDTWEGPCSDTMTCEITYRVEPRPDGKSEVWIEALGQPSVP